MHSLRYGAIALCVFLLFSDCKSPSEPNCIDQTSVLEKDPEYMARPEALTPAPGHLTKNCQANPRYCYYFGNGSVGVFTQGNQTILDPFVDRDVLIVGKVVFPATGPGELWAGTICRFR